MRSVGKELHHHLQDVVHSAAFQAMLGPRREVLGLKLGTDDRPADVLDPGEGHGD